MRTAIIALMALILVSTVCASPSKTEIGLYLLNLGKFDISTGGFTADFYLSMKCESNCTDFEFQNGRASVIDKMIDLPNEKFYRIQANLVSPVELEKFPFDHQAIEIQIEDKKLTDDKLVYSPIAGESGIDDSIVFTGWQIDNWTATVAEHAYPIYNETYSRYLFTVNISKIELNAFFKTFLPVLFILLILMCSFIMDPDKITTRIGVVTSNLIAAVMYHISISNQIPPVSYLTTADKFMLLTYALLLGSVIINVIILELAEQKNVDLVEKIHRRTEYTAFIMIPLLVVGFFLFFA